MKVLAINTVDLDYNGITDCLYQYLKAMDYTGLQIDILAGTGSNSEMTVMFRLLGNKVYHIGNRKKNPFSYMWKLRRLIKQNRYDIVHVHGNSATMAFDLLGAKLGGCKVRIAHSHNTSCQHVVEDKMLRPLFNFLVTERFACGQAAGKWLFGKKDFRVIPNGRDLKKFSYNENIRNKYRKELNVKDSFVIGHIGGFNSTKNQKFALDVFKEVLKLHGNSRIIFAGDGELLESTKRYAEELGIQDKVFFLGKISNVDVLLSAIDVMILPSLYEGMPLVVLESQAEGVPCVLSDTVTKECKICDFVNFLSLSEKAENWAKVIINMKEINRMETQKRGQKLLKKAGYDIIDNAINLKLLYEKMIIR